MNNIAWGYVEIQIQHMVKPSAVFVLRHPQMLYYFIYKMLKNFNLRKEVEIAIKSKETSSQLELVRNSHV